MSVKCKHILSLTAEEKQTFLDSFNIVVSDCDGVLWTISMPLPDTGKAVNLLKENGKQFKFMSNNGMWSEEQFTEKIKNIGVQNRETNDIVIPVKGIAKYMNKHFPGQQCHFLGTDIFYETIRAHGVNVVNVTPPRNIQLIDTQMAVTPQAHAPLIVDVNTNMTYADFIKIHQYALQENSKIFVSAADSHLSIGEHFSIIAPAEFLKIVWQNCKTTAEVFGKPSHIMSDYLIEEFNIQEHKNCLFVGDNLIVDIQFGCRNGFQTLFVLTGCHNKDDMLKRPVEDQPDYYADSLSDFIEFFKDIKLIK